MKIFNFVVSFLFVFSNTAHAIKTEVSGGVIAGTHNIDYEISGSKYNTDDFDFAINLGVRVGHTFDRIDIAGIIEYGLANRFSDVGPESTVISGRTVSQNNYHQILLGASVGIYLSQVYRIDINYAPYIAQNITYAERKSENIHYDGDKNSYSGFGLSINRIENNILLGLGIRIMNPSNIKIKQESKENFTKSTISQAEIKAAYIF